MSLLCAQAAEFTRILDGEIANDLGNFSGCAWGDYDGDGHLDLVIGNAFGGSNRLYRNNGDGTFTRITTGSLVTDSADADAIVWGDYDNDGDLDLFVSNFFTPVADVLYRNVGASEFERVTEGWVNDSSQGTGAAWGDYDADGFLDLYVSNSNAQNDYLYRNSGDGIFALVVTGPVVSSGGHSTGCAWGDYDGDGDLDLVVANTGDSGLGENNFLFRNEGGAVFTRVAEGPIANDGGRSNGVAWADYDNDGDLDLFVSNAFGENNFLYRNDGPSGFARITEGFIVNDGGNSTSLAWGDFDNDGWLDLFVANDLGQNNFLYRNEGDGTFSPMPASAVESDGGRSWGCAWGDYDNDGDLDLFVANGLADSVTPPPPEVCFLYRNSGNTNNWLLVRMIGTASNRSGIGAKVRVLATIDGTSIWQLREISGGSGWCSQNDLRAHFGLGDAVQVEKLRIEWPSGIVQEFTDVAANQILKVVEPPRLTVEPGGRLSWPVRAEGYRLESATSVGGPWSEATETLTTEGTWRIATIEPNGEAKFYRLDGE
jgi:hypothetical protein